MRVAMSTSPHLPHAFALLYFHIIFYINALFDHEISNFT